jgi:hypothetical protein
MLLLIAALDSRESRDLAHWADQEWQGCPRPVGMHELVEALGGKLRAGPLAAGWAVQASLPVACRARP